jgi:HK97 family phage prohead protease
MLTRDYCWKLKSLEEAGVFSGLASPYGPPVDLAGDEVAPGAYSAAIAAQGTGYPVLWSHDTSQPIGVARIGDSPAGLLVDGSLVMADPVAQRAYQHLRAKSMRGLSIGYTLPQDSSKVVQRADGSRLLREIHLHEISLVAVPAAPRAQVTSVKTLGDVRHVLKSFRDGQVDEDALSELLEIDRELKRLLVGRDPAEARAAMLRELQAFAGDLARIGA